MGGKRLVEALYRQTGRSNVEYLSTFEIIKQMLRQRDARREIDAYLQGNTSCKNSKQEV